MMRGFRKVVALLCIRRYLGQMTVEGRASSALLRLLRIEFDHQLLVHVVGEFRAVGEVLEHALEIRRIDFDPAGEAVRRGEIEGNLTAQLHTKASLALAPPHGFTTQVEDRPTNFRS